MAKKKKGKKKAKEKVVEETPEDIFLRELTIIVEENLRNGKWALEDEETKKSKKKLTKKDKARLAARRAEELRITVEAERARLLEEQKRREEEERIAALEKEIQDQVEHNMRLDHLKDSCGFIKKLKRRFLKMELRGINDEEWDQYLKCDGSPEPSNCGQMNTFLHLWDKVKESTSVEDAAQKTEIVLMLLDQLEDFIDCPATSEQKKREWILVRNAFRTYQQSNLDWAAYRLLRDIYANLNRDNLTTSSYVSEQKNYTICLWVLLQLPIPIPNPKKPPRPRQVLNFPELSMEVVFPETVDVWAMSIRAMYVCYDHFSYMCRSFDEPSTPKELTQDLNTVTQNEWLERMRLKTEEVSKPKPKTGASSALPALMTTLDMLKKQPPKVDISAMYIGIEDAQYVSFRKHLTTLVDNNEVNLRKYRIIGGIFFLNLFHQPPQPTTLVTHDITISTLELPKWLSEVEFKIEYLPPPAPEPGVTRKPEEIEAELKKQEQEFDKLLYITISLPSTVLWLDVPIVCQWDVKKKIWSTETIHDVKHNEEKQIVQFRTGEFGAFGMAMFKYSNMPYQAWEMKPAPGGKVTFSLIAAVLIIEFTVCNNLICVSQLQNAPNDALDSIIGIYYNFTKLKRILQNGGVDVFPAIDAFCYTEGVCEKHYAMEHHLYYNMAQCSLTFNFAWSRWNLLAGRRKAVMQLREWPSSDRVKLPHYSMLMVTPLKALLVDCTEVSQTFSEEGLPRMKFYSDMYHLILGISSINLRDKLKKIPVDLINTVAQLLSATRVVSFSS